MSKLRLFFALWPDASFCEQFTQLVEQSAWSRQGRSVPSQNLHLTLAFLGDVDVSRVDTIIALADGFSIPAFDLVFDHLGYWKKPQVVWAGTRDVPPALTKLAYDLQAGLRALNIPVDEREYVPHLTLLRKVARRPLLVPIESCSWHVNEFCLVHSQLTPAGAHYHIVKSWRFVANG